MAQCKQTPQDFIKNAFTPQIAVMCTPLAEKACEKNNLSFIELLQPFSKLSSDVYYKDPSGGTITIRNLKLTFLDVNARPPQTTLARKFLNFSVSEVSEPRFPAGDHKSEAATSAPWFESWRDTFLRVQYPSDHEYTKHFLSCILVVSASDSNPLETVVQLAQSLNQMVSNAPGKLPKWFNSNILKYYVVLQDNIENVTDIASEAYESIKVSYGESNCFLLRMNSRPPGEKYAEHLPDPWSQFLNNQIESKYNKQTPESSPSTSRVFDTNQDSTDIGKMDLNYHPLSPDTEELNINGSLSEKEKSVTNLQITKKHGLCLSTDDVEQVKLLIYEFCKGCLLPYIEKQVQQLNDVISNKKGVSRSLFSATKRWFNPNRPGAGSVAVNNLIYAPDSPELQVRRLGDLYFMFGNYNLAFQAYHLAKRDYNTDQAWLYYAGALEMASLSAFMANEASRKTFDYMEEAITTYLNTCKMSQFATRATLLSSECLKSRGMFGEAALQLIRMTSEESDLRSALFLEQAAYCFLHSKMIRKYAFHMVLGGHRFSKAAQRRHSLRSYKQAYQVYEKSGWDLAEDHIHYTIGRQAHNLHSFDEAVISFAKLLKGDSKQSSQQQGIFLKEYLTILGNKLKSENSDEAPLLAIPELDNKSLKLLMGPTPPLTTPGKIPAIGISINDQENNKIESKWYKLEEILVQEAQDSVPPLFKPMITLYTINNLHKSSPFAIVNEPIQLCIRLVNSLQIVTQLKDMYLLWKYKNDGVNVTNVHPDSDVDTYVKTHVAKSVLIEGCSTQNLILSLTPLATGELDILGICYTLCSSTNAADSIEIKGKQLFNIPINSKTIDNNNRLLINVVPSAPCLQVSFSELNLEFLCDEVQKVTIDFRNTGTVPLHNVYMATTVPHLLCNCDHKTTKQLPTYTPDCIPAVKDRLMRDSHVTCVPLPSDRLDPEQCTTITIWTRAPNKPGPCVIDLLIYYENINANFTPRYRLVRHSWNLTVQESIKVELSTQESCNSKIVEELDLVMKITNLNKVHSATLTEIKLLNVGILSRYWTLTEDIVTPKFITLHSEECVHLLVKARRIVESKNKYSTILLNTENSIWPSINNVYFAFAKKSEQCKSNIFDNVENDWKDSENGILLLQWQASHNETNNKRFVNGQTQIPIEIKLNNCHKFGNDDLLLSEVCIDKKIDDNSEQAKVIYNLIYPAVVEHNFSNDKLCTVPVKLLIHSIVRDTILNVIINTLGATNGIVANSSSLIDPYASRNFTWLGTGSATKMLRPLSTEPVELAVVVSQPGTFDLGARLEITCNTIDSPAEFATLQTCQIQSTLIVVNGNS